MVMTTERVQGVADSPALLFRDRDVRRESPVGLCSPSRRQFGGDWADCQRQEIRYQSTFFLIKFCDLHGPGYLFCNELMPPDHELRLMLVNTLRKVRDFGTVV